MSNAERTPGHSAVALPPTPEITQSREVKQSHEVRYDSSKHRIKTCRDPIVLISINEINEFGNTDFQILPKDFLLPIALSKHDAYGNYPQIRIPMRNSTESIGSTRETGDYTLGIETLTLELIHNMMRELIFHEYKIERTTDNWGPFSVIMIEYYEKNKEIV